MSSKNKRLLIVESPKKVKTISSYFPDNSLSVIATYGHVRSLLPKPNSISFDNDDIKFTWIINNNHTVENILKQISQCDEIIFATDWDREGEAIVWHLFNLMKEKKLDVKKKISRIVFQEITPKSIKTALNNPQEINQNLVNAYLARLSQDYSCGFSITEKMWNKLRCGYSSAGRVQSPTLELIRKREEEIRHFISKEYYSITCDLIDKENEKNNVQEVLLNEHNGKKLSNQNLNNKNLALKIEKTINDVAEFIIYNHEVKQTKSNSLEPLRTSSLQQMANSQLNYDGKKTMMIAQSLYEGIKINDDIVGLITYMRTDSSFLSNEFLSEIREYIKQEYGDEFIAKKVASKKRKNAQEAHEAIRPTSMKYHPQIIRKFLSNEQYRLYSLIWNVTLCATMEPPEYLNFNLLIKLDTEVDFLLKKTFKSVAFKGFLILQDKKNKQDKEESEEFDDTHDLSQIEVQNVDDKLLNIEELKEIYPINKKLFLEKVNLNVHKTMPPARYNFGSLVKKMEEIGIGRPSTYVGTIEMLLKYNYCFVKNNSIFLNAKGAIVSLFLQSYFFQFLQEQYTMQMEQTLDEIACNEKDWKQEILLFYKNLTANLLQMSSVSTINIIQDLSDKFFSTFNMPKVCEKCQNNTLSLAIKITIFIRCTACGANFLLESILDKERSLDFSNIFEMQDYGKTVIVKNKNTNKKFYVPYCVKRDEINTEFLQWMEKLPREVANGISLKIGKFSFYLDKGEEKVMIIEKSMSNLMKITDEEFVNYKTKSKKKLDDKKTSNE